MPRPIWTGAISFGLLNIPVQLMPAERRRDLHFHLLDSRDKKRVRYERINADTGEEVPWKDVVKAFEYSKGNYVVLEESDIRDAAPDSKESVDIEAFVDPAQISLRHYDKPYYLVPARKAEKGYVLLRETLAQQQRAGLARVVIRTREYLALVLPEGPALVLMLLRYAEELIAADEYRFPEKSLKQYRLSPRELEMAQQLVKSMSAKWKPDAYRNEFRKRLQSVVNARVRKGRSVKSTTTAPTPEPSEAGSKVVDFMALLKKSIDENRRTPPARTATKKATRKKAIRKKKSTATKATPRRSARR